MWYPLAGFLCILLITRPALGQTTKFPTNPDQVQFVTQDIPRFWEAYDLHWRDTLQNPFQKYYLDKGSPGVKDFNQNRIYNKAPDKKRAIAAILNITDYPAFLKQSGYLSKN